MSRKRLIAFFVVVALPAAAQTASAQVEVDVRLPELDLPAIDPSVVTFVRGGVSRARRAVAIGPTVGAGFAYAPEPDESGVPISFGLGFRLFKVPVVPDPQMIRELIQDRVKAKLKERAKQMILEGRPPPTDAELVQWAREFFEEVKAEVLGTLSTRAKTMEKPRLAIDLELARVIATDQGAWLLRTGAGVGIWKLTIGPTLAWSFVEGDGDGLFVGGELAVRFLPGKGPRSLVIDVFLRADFGVTENVDDVTFVGAGARALVDII